MCAPTSEPFSTTTTERSASICFSLIAAARPAGPAPTITTSKSMLSRGSLAASCPLIVSLSNSSRRHVGRPIEKPRGGQLTGSPSNDRDARSFGVNADPSDTRALESLLRWYAAMGVDASVDEEPHDRFVTPAPASPPPERVSASPQPIDTPTRGGAPRPAAPAPASAEAQIRQAEALAADATTLEELHARWATLPGCGLAATAARMIFSGGTAGAPLMLIGSAPEADDERQGEAFAGRHGQLLDAMLRAIGLARADVYLTNVIPWRPPGGRPPTPLELGLCLPFTRRHIALADPERVLCLGERAAQPLLNTRDPISRLRGRWLAYEGEAKTVRTLVTFSPDYLLKQPLQKRRAWSDLQMLAGNL